MKGQYRLDAEATSVYQVKKKNKKHCEHQKTQGECALGAVVPWDPVKTRPGPFGYVKQPPLLFSKQSG